MGMKTRLISFLWGAAEASFFFVVPDVWLSRVALMNLREAFINVLLAVIGALVGGVIVFYIGGLAFEGVRSLINLIPAIHSDMVDGVGADVQNRSFLLSMIDASVSGVPYKIYALWAGHINLSLSSFLLFTVIARSLRFIGVVIIARGVGIFLRRFISFERLLIVHLVFWCVFYVFYFYKMGI